MGQKVKKAVQRKSTLKVSGSASDFNKRRKV